MKLLQTSFRSPLSRTTSRKGSCNSCTTVCRPAEWGSLKAPQERYVSLHHSFHTIITMVTQYRLVEEGSLKAPQEWYVSTSYSYTVIVFITWLHGWYNNLSKEGRLGISESPIGMVCVSTSYSFHAIVTTYKSTSYMVWTGKLCYFNSQ